MKIENNSLYKAFKIYFGIEKVNLFGSYVYLSLDEVYYYIESSHEDYQLLLF